MKKISFFTCIVIMAVIVILNTSCGTQRQPLSNNGCGSENYKHKFRAGVQLLPGGTIAKALEPRRVELIKVRPTMLGWKHTFTTDSTDTIVQYFPKPLKKQRYLLQTI